MKAPHSPPSKLNHPAFGPCELVPSILAIKLKRQLDNSAIKSVLAAQNLSLASTTPTIKEAGSGATRDPRAVNINQSETLAWASPKTSSRAALKRVETDGDIEWVAPVYRATKADPGPNSYFAINPTVLLLTEAAAGAVGDLNGIDESASVDRDRTKLLKGFVVLNLPNGNAIQLAEKINELTETQGVTGGVKFENIPYISPLCGGCGCAGKEIVAVEKGDCSPSTVAIIPNDTFYPQQWGLQRINAPSAWPLTEGDPNVVVAVLDQGVELTHPDLNLWPISYSTITHTNNGGPVGSHGTPCAGIIGARIDNALGVSGLAGKCRVMAIATNFADTEVAEGLYFAANNGARVVSMSFGAYPSWMIWDFTIIEAALQYCQDKNVVLVAASGNENQNVSRFPGSDPRTICVGGSNRADVRKAAGDTSIEPFWGACFGPDVDVVAPCLEIPTTDRFGGAGYTPTDYNMRFNGTSSATPHVAALAGLIISLNPGLNSNAVRQIISETTDKINALGYTYLPTAGKPYGTWHSEVGYGRINVERALLIACSSGSHCKESDRCCVELPRPDGCCVSPCDPPWRPDQQCFFWYESKFFRQPIGRAVTPQAGSELTAAVPEQPVIEFRITYQHKLCLLGKQHGGLIYTVTLLPGEKLTLYHSDRYRRITSVQNRYSVRTTFTQFLSAVHQARVTSTFDQLSATLAKTSSSASESLGISIPLVGSGSTSSSKAESVTDHNQLHVSFVSDQFNQSVVQSSQMTEAERSVVVSTYEDKESVDVTSRIIHNENACRAVTYFVRRVVELYAFSTVVSDISYRIIGPNIPGEWHSTRDVAWLPQQVRNQIQAVLGLLPKIGDVIEQPKPISIPTDGTVYDPELAHCCSCEPERAAAIAIQLQKQKAEALKLCLEAQVLELELQRRRMLLQKGELAPFDAATPVPELGPEFVG